MCVLLHPVCDLRYFLARNFSWIRALLSVSLVLKMRGCKKMTNIRYGHTSYLSRTQGRCPWRKNLSCGEISNFCTWRMRRNLKFLHMWINFTFHHMTDVEKSEISFNMCTIYGILLHFKLFCCKICVFFCDLRCFVAKLVCCDLRAFVWRKF